jgi:hypothetical protein
VFFAIVTQLGFDPVWFGVLIVLVVQIGLISPPVGTNLFVLNAPLDGVTLTQIFLGVWLFVLVLVLVRVLVPEFPALSLCLPGFMKQGQAALGGAAVMGWAGGWPGEGRGLGRGVDHGGRVRDDRHASRRQCWRPASDNRQVSCRRLLP